MHRTLTDAHNIAEWHKRADRLRALAKATHAEGQRKELLDLAEQWEGMARQAEAVAREVPPLHRRRAPAGSS